MENKAMEIFAKDMLSVINKTIFDDLFPDEPDRHARERLDFITKNGKTKIVDVRRVMLQMAKANEISREWVNYFFKRMAGHRRYQNGVWVYGYEITYNPVTKAIYAEDKHEADVQVTNEQNRAWAHVWINNDKNGDTSGEYRIRAERLDDFLYEKGVDAKTVRFARASIDTFYAYETGRGRQYFVNQTPAITRARKGAPSADFWRLDINKSSHDNDWGFTFAVWEDHLVEDYGGIYVSDGMTDSDYEIVMAGYNPGSHYAKEVTRIYKATKDGVKQAAKKIKETRERFQAAIDAHKADIMAHMAKRAGISQKDTADKSILHAASERYGLDCGWVNFKFADNEQMDNTVKTASLSGDMVGVFGNGTFSLNLPYNTQSTTMQSFEAEAAIEAIEKECGERLKFTVTLD